jgi:hypothetical protein
MEREWALEAEVTLNNKTMEEMLIEAFGCVSVDDRLIRIYVSADRNMMKRDFCRDGLVIDSQTMYLPAKLRDPSTMWRQGLLEKALAA